MIILQLITKNLFQNIDWSSKESDSQRNLASNDSVELPEQESEDVDSLPWWFGCQTQVRKDWDYTSKATRVYEQNTIKPAYSIPGGISDSCTALF